MSTKKGKAHCFRRLMQLCKPYKGALFQGMFCIMFMAMLALTIPWSIMIVIDNVLIGGDFNLLVWILVGILVAYGFRELFLYISHYLVFYSSQRVVFDLRRKLFDHLQRLSITFYENRKSGKLLSRVMNDVALLENLIQGGTFSVFLNLFVLVAVLGIIFFLNWKLALIAIIVLPLYALSFSIFKKKIIGASHDVREKVAVVTGNLSEIITGARVVKSFAAENRERRFFAGDLKEMFWLNLKRLLLSVKCQMISEYLVAVGTVIVLGFGGWTVINGDMTLGTFVAFFSYIGMLYNPVVMLVGMVTVFLNAMAGAERVFEILNTPADILDAPDARSIQIQGKIEFKNVCFAYNGDGNVIEDLSFTIYPGEVIALVGPSGSGKTTIANLINRFYDITDGQILIDGVDVRKIKLKSLRRQIGMVLQENFLFSGTFADNIRYSNFHASIEQIKKAAVNANISEFIESQPDGYYTTVGENGSHLSGGQKQRIAIARAMLMEPKIFILDEATSHLDTTSELLIKDALKKLEKDRTTIIVAHKLETIKSADRIFVMSNGRLVQVGTHDELLQVEGMYRSLYYPRLYTGCNEDNKHVLLRQVG